MSVFEVLSRRRSIRKYQNKVVEEDKIRKVLEAARLGPSANNQQPCQFILIKNQQVKESLKNAYDRAWFLSAPVIVVGCVNPKEAWRKGFMGEEYWKVDLAIAMQNLILTATELGLGTCWIADFNEKAIKKALEIPNDIRVVALTPLGYPDEQRGLVTDRKPIEKMLHYEHW